MADIIPFPSKDIFTKQFEGKIPKELFDEIMEAYNRNKKLSEKFPKFSITIPSEYKSQALDFYHEHKTFALMLFKKILSLEVDLILKDHRL